MKLALFLISLLFSTIICSSNSSVHQTVIVSLLEDDLNQLHISGGTINLNLKNKKNHKIATDDTSSLSWNTSGILKKITISSNLPNSQYTLKAQAKNISGGTSTGLIKINNFQQDFIINIDNVYDGICDILYVAKFKNTDLRGRDIHFITYTLTDS